MSSERKGIGDGNRLAIVSAAVAVLSLCASILQNVNYARSIDSMQRNILRGESLRGCKELIDIYFRFRLKAELANMAGASASEMVELKALAYQFGALGTHLANFRADVSRERYAALSWHLNRIAGESAGLPKDDFQKLFDEADKQFGSINDDCVKAATGQLL